jgi:bifunctional enzyme CysN/CysC
MTASAAARALTAAEMARAELDQYVETVSRRSLLRFLTCGSVDDGKSTLIGRLLYDSKMLFDDQLLALQRDSKGGEIDFSLLVDGLAAEREQGITIDVAYRFFTTDVRKFIVADTPGHEQYTRNMVTGASTADLAIILIDARKGVLDQTRRHSALVHLLGIRHLVVAVNKMDLVGYDAARFDAIVADFSAFADEAGIAGFTAIPLSGLAGDNVTTRSAAMPWYDGPVLLDHLEAVPVAARSPVAEPLRMAVQAVIRPNQDFRGYAGRLSSGRVRVGDDITVLPSGRTSRVTGIVTFDGELQEAISGQSVTLTLADEIDISRGDLIAGVEDAAVPAQTLRSTLVWMDEAPLVPGRSYWLKIGARTVSATVNAPEAVIDINTLERRSAPSLTLNDIGEAIVSLDRAVPAVRYADNRRLGGFILIDKASNATVAAGLVLEANQAERHHAGEGHVRWIVGPGREAHARDAYARLHALGRPVAVLDAEALATLGHLPLVETARAVARLMSQAGVEVLIPIEVSEEEARPGKREIASANAEEGDSEWVI